MSIFSQQPGQDVQWDYVVSVTDRLRDLRLRFSNGDYTGVIQGCNELLKEYPSNKSVRKLKRMASRRMNNFDLRLGMTVFCMALVVTAASLSYMNKKIVHELREKDMQINSLIDEVGELKDENLILYNHLTSNVDALGLVQQSLVDIQSQVEAVDSSEEVFALQKELDEAYSRLDLQSKAVDTLVDASVGFSVDDAFAISADDTLDILVLGTHGRLTDTILLASVNPELKTVSLFSIPRDLAVGGRRINEYYNKFGIDSMRTKIQEITGLYPEKYVVFDLATFEEVIDILGGVDVYVEKDLNDTMYPGPNFTYETFSVSAGWHHMDGKMALRYARSRKSTTDFDRAVRQQAIIEAVRDEVEDLNLLSNTDELISMYTAVSDGMDTDVDVLTFIAYLTKYHDFAIEKGHVFSTTNYLYSTYGVTGAYLLLPKAGENDYSEIKAYIAEVVTQ